MMPADPASAYDIQTRDLNLWYGTFQALKQVTVNIRQGLITALIGPSGCGKTTFLRCSNRLNERYGNVKTTGAIHILRKNIYDADVNLSELRKAVGMVFQRPNPLPISIYDNVIFGLRVHTAPRTLTTRTLDDLVESSLREVDLWDAVKDKLRQKATMLTLEQQQKLCIARLVPLKPRVILMDEPCSALDAKGTAAIERLMDDLRGKFTILIVTHNMAQARRVSEESIFMLMGEVVEHAPTTDLFLKPSRKETEMYVEGRYG
jgi:phosphate transport system ATP-binding protein